MTDYKIYYLENDTDYYFEPDCLQKTVVVAESEVEARQLVCSFSGGEEPKEFWLDEQYCRCIEFGIFTGEPKFSQVIMTQYSR